jgi:hypothetical protein
MTIDGQVDERFVAGMKYEAYNIIRGIRLSQQLNQMGLEQAKPVIEMAREMRQAEGQAAQILASQFGQSMAQSNQQILGAIHELAAAQSQPQVSTGNPLAQALFTAMQPYIAQTVGQIMSSIFKKPQGAPGQPTANQPVVEQPPQQPEKKGPPPHLRPGEEESEWTEA